MKKVIISGLLVLVASGFQCSTPTEPEVQKETQEVKSLLQSKAFPEWLCDSLYVWSVRENVKIEDIPDCQKSGSTVDFAIYVTWPQYCQSGADMVKIGESLYRLQCMLNPGWTVLSGGYNPRFVTLLYTLK